MDTDELTYLEFYVTSYEDELSGRLRLLLFKQCSQNYWTTWVVKLGTFYNPNLKRFTAWFLLMTNANKKKGSAGRNTDDDKSECF